MSVWPLRNPWVRLCLSAGALLATLSYGAESETTPVIQHPLVTATEALYQRNLPQATDELMKLAAMAPGANLARERGLPSAESRLVQRARREPDPAGWTKLDHRTCSRLLRAI